MEKVRNKQKIDDIVIMWGILGILVVVILVLTVALIVRDTTNDIATTAAENESIVPGKYRIVSYRGKEYYIFEEDYDGEYNIQRGSFEEKVYDTETMERDVSEIDSLVKEFNTTKVMDYAEYVKFCDKWQIGQAYNDSGGKYVVIAYASIGSANAYVGLADVTIDDDVVRVYMYDNLPGNVADSAYYVLTVPVEKDVTKVDVVDLVTEEEFQDIMQDSASYDLRNRRVDKPVIYLYPTTETKISVKLGYPGLLTTTYPKYNDGWDVLAEPDGTLKDLSTGRELYSLYYESIHDGFKRTDEGFVVKGEDSAAFLEEKLAVLGLSERETEEFIVYWLPKLESHPYNYIRFASAEEIANVMPLLVTPTPDNVVRVLMIFEGIDEPVPVRGQVLVTPKRDGFTVVEWGGAEI